MKKFLLLTVMCVFGLFTLNAQQTSFSCDFNDGTLNGWNILDLDNDGHSWQLSLPNSGYSGVDNSYGIVSMSYRGAMYPDNIIVTTSKYAITADSKLKFNHMTADYNFPIEGVSVVVSADGTNFENVWSYNYVSGALAWNEDVVSLADYAGQELHIGIRHHNCNDNSTALKVDNIVLTADAGNDDGEEPTPEPTPEDIQLITVGTGNQQTSDIPFNSWFNYAISQQIYTADELAAAGITEGDIWSISFKSANVEIDDRNLMIFMQNTDKPYFTTDNNTAGELEIVSANDLVFEGIVGIVGKDTWCTANFSKSFEYTGGNILVYIVDKTGEYLSNPIEFYSYATENYSSLYDRRDNAEFPPYDTRFGLVLKQKNLVQFGVASGDAPVDPTPDGDAATTFAFNFDDGTFTGLRVWNEANAVGTGWQITPDDPVLGSFYQGTDGTDCAVSISTDALSQTMYKPNSYFVTENAYQITATSKLSWNMKCPFAVNAEYYEVVVSSDNETFTAIWSESKSSINSLVAKEISLAEYAGQTLYIGFHHYRETSSSNGGVLCIDDVVLSSEGGGEEPEPQAPAAPANLVAEAAGANSIVLTWDAVAGATSYNVYDEYDVIATTEETTYTVEGLAAATNYCFVVTALNEAGESFASAQACATTDEEQQGGESTAQTIIVGEDGTDEANDLPIACYYEYSITQQIYTAADMNYAIGDITKIAFYQLGTQQYTRNLSVYMINTDKETFAGEYGWATVTSDDLVFEGELTTPGADQWFEIELQTPFTYTGGNLLVCVDDNTGSWKDNLRFKTFATDYIEGQGVSISARTDGYNYDALNLAEEWGTLSSERNTIQLTINSEPGLTVSPKDGIALGTIQLGNYWPEKAEASVNVSVSAIERTVASITCDNDFFVLSEIDLTAAPIKFTVGYDKEAAAGEYTGTLTVTAVEGDVVEVPMTATIYNPVEPDVFELAREITFTNNAYTDAPDFTTLHDDYVLPNEGENGLAPDAVYAFTLESDNVIKAEVEGEGGFYAIYRADSIGDGKGPQANNNYKGTETILSTACEYDFEDGSLDAFTVQDLDVYTDYCWYIQDGKLRSKSFDSWGEYGTDTWGTMNEANERVITNEAYTITPYTVLTLDMDEVESGTYLYLRVEVTQDGENFTELTTFQTPPYYFKEDYMKEIYPEYFDENGNFITLKRADLGALFIAEGLEYGDYRISLRADNGGGGDLLVDNVTLTERAGVYEAGDYYLVAAAKEAFTLNVELENVGGNDPIIPEEPKDYRIASIEGVANTVYTYESENSNKVVEINTDGLIDVLEYNAQGLLAGYTTTAEGSTDVIAEVEYIYNNGKLVGYNEVAQGWTGPMTEEATFVYNAQGQITEVVSSKMTTQFTYNAEGLVSEKLLMYDGEIDSKEVYEYANGRLIKNSYYGYDWWENYDFYLGEVYEYEYDANGNCTTEKQYLVNDDESLSLFYVNEFSYNNTIAYEDVFYFEYPHLAILYPAKPSHSNIITKEFSYYQYMDGEEVITNSEVETIYNYNPELSGEEPEEIGAPTNITAVATGANSILLSWDPVEGAAGYGIYLDGQWLGGFYNTVLEYEFVGFFDPETTYCFTMTTITEIDAEGYIVGETEPSDEVCATTEASSVPAPSNIVVKAISDTELQVSWDAVDGALGYGIYAMGQWAGAIQETTVVFDQLTPDTEYCFAIFSISEIDAEGYIVGFSETSDEVCGKTQGIGVEEFSTAFNIYPNPVNDVLFIENGNNIEEVSIYTITGVMVYNEQCVSNNVQVNVSEFEAGLYIIKVRTENNEIINRFIKK